MEAKSRTALEKLHSFLGISAFSLSPYTIISSYGSCVVCNSIFRYSSVSGTGSIPNSAASRMWSPIYGFLLSDSPAASASPSRGPAVMPPSSSCASPSLADGEVRSTAPAPTTRSSAAAHSHTDGFRKLRIWEIRFFVLLSPKAAGSIYPIPLLRSPRRRRVCAYPARSCAFIFFNTLSSQERSMSSVIKRKKSQARGLNQWSSTARKQTGFIR